MKTIPLSQGKVAIVDDEDYDFVNQWKWCCSSQNYACRNIGGGKTIYMHRLINKTPKGLVTDHIDRNGLNNQKNNLRAVTHSQNHFNVDLSKNNTSGIKGVSFNKAREKWVAYIMVNYAKKSLGYFNNIKAAASARLGAEEIHHSF